MECTAFDLGPRASEWDEAVPELDPCPLELCPLDPCEPDPPELWLLAELPEEPPEWLPEELDPPPDELA